MFEGRDAEKGIMNTFGKVAGILLVSLLNLGVFAQLMPPGGSGCTNCPPLANNYTPPNYGSNLWIEINGVTNNVVYYGMTTNEVYLTFHNTTTIPYYALLAQTNLASPFFAVHTHHTLIMMDTGILIGIALFIRLKQTWF